MTTYAVLPLPPAPAYPIPCPACSGRGVTGDRYEVPTTETGAVLLVDVICPECGGCGNGAAEHWQCPPDAHADPDDKRVPVCECNGGPRCDCPDCGHPDCVYRGDDQACPSCGSGRGWYPARVTGIGTSDAGNPEGLAVLRMPCGCAEARMVTSDDSASLVVASAIVGALDALSEDEEDPPHEPEPWTWAPTRPSQF